MLPVHERMEPPEPRDPLRPGAQHQVVGVAEEDVSPGLAHGFRLHRLHRRGGADRHEGRRADFPTLHGDDAGARLAVGGVEREGETGSIMRLAR